MQVKVTLKDKDTMNHSWGLQIYLMDFSKFSLRCGYSTLPLQIDSNSSNSFLWVFQSSLVVQLAPQGTCLTSTVRCLQGFSSLGSFTSLQPFLGQTSCPEARI